MRLVKRTRILGIFGADIVVAGKQHILVHEGGARGDLSKEGDLDRLAILDLLASLHENLAGKLATVLAVERGHTVGLGVVALLEGLEGTHEVVATGDAVGNDALADTGSDGALDNGGDRVHGTDNLGLELGRDVELNLLEEVLGGTEATDDQDILQGAVLGLDGNNLVADELENAVDDGLKALENLFVGKGHVALFDASLGELSLDADVDGPLLTVVAEIGLDAVLKVHDALGVDAAGRLGAIGKLHLANLGAQNVGKVAVEGGGTARVTGTSRALGDGKGVLLLDLIGNQIDGTTTTIDNEDGVVDLEVEQASLGAKEGGGFGLGDEGQAVVVFVAEEAGLDGGGTGGGLAGIVPNGGDGQVVSNVALLTVKHLAKRLLKGGAHGLAQLKEVVGGDINLGLARGQRGEVDGVNVGVAAEHELELEPLDLLDAGLGVAGGSEGVGRVRAPADDLLVLVVVENGGDLGGVSGKRGCVLRGGKQTFCLV